MQTGIRGPIKSSDILNNAQVANDLQYGFHSIIDAYIHQQERSDVLPGWEFWGILPNGDRIYASTRDELRRRIYAAIVERSR